MKKESYTVASINVFGAFSVDNQQKCIKMYAISNKTALLWKQSEKAAVDNNVLLHFRWEEKWYF